MAQYIQKNYKPIDPTVSQEEIEEQRRKNRTGESQIVPGQEKGKPQSDKLQLMNAVASSYVAKNVSPEQREAVTTAISNQIEVRGKADKLPLIPVYDHKEPSQNQEVKSRSPVDRETEHVR